MKRNIVIGAVAAAVIVIAALIVILVPFGGPSGPSNVEARKKADTLFVAMRDQGGKATFKTVEPDGDGLVIKGLTITPPEKATKGKKRTVTIDELRIREMDWKNTKQPDFADIEFKGLRVPELKDDPQFQEFSKTTGLQELVVSGRIKYRIDKGKQQLVVEPVSLQVDGMGAYTFMLTLEGINVDQLQNATKGAKPNPGQMMALMSALRLRSLSIKIDDKGGVEKMLKMAGAKENKSAEDVRKEQLAKIEALSASPMAKSKLAAEALAAAKKFLSSPGTLTIEAKPPSPVALFPVVMGVMTGGAKPEVLDQIKTQLGLTITAE